MQRPNRTLLRVNTLFQAKDKFNKAFDLLLVNLTGERGHAAGAPLGDGFCYVQSRLAVFIS